MERFFNLPGLSGILTHRFFVPVIISTFAVAYIYRNKKQIKELEDKAANDAERQSGCCQNACGREDNATENKCCSAVNVPNGYQYQPYVIIILYATQTGTSRKLACLMYEKIRDLSCSDKIKPILVDVANFDLKNCLKEHGVSGSRAISLVFFVSTHDDGNPPTSAADFFSKVKAGYYDEEMQKITFAIFGLGNSVYKDLFCKAANDFDELFMKSGAVKIFDTQLFDEDSGNDVLKVAESWYSRVLANIDLLLQSSKAKATWIDQIDEEVLFATDEFSDQHESSEEEDDYEEDEHNRNDIGDIEDLVALPEKNKVSNGDVKEMTNEIIRKNLTKQGYKLVGSHSAVKMCRWTKSMLRGRGGCYKHTFYGIESHRCMETTPSLACANKCVFCWRHHTNPVGTEWKWQMNEPEFIVEEIIKNHVKMINEFKGVPGVLPERIEEGFKVRHCALSLVGEPIMYPKINELLKLLHYKGISTFLVTNAQFPEEIRNLTPITQLYVSVDASTPEALKRIDRPLFKNSWDRFIFSLEALYHKKIRTVYRLTLVKSWNTDEIENYADLVIKGNPDFIEIKGVTFCGTSKAGKITMDNVPWHEEVVKFSQALAAEIDHDWEIVSEHEHSNCVLIAQKKFKINGKWHTWIDFDKFITLVKRYYDSDGKEEFDALDYALETPEWALFGSKEQGFDPKEKRFNRKTKV